MNVRFQANESLGDGCSMSGALSKDDLMLARQHLLGSRNSILLIVQKVFDLYNSLDVRFGVNSLTRRIFFGTQGGKLTLPIPQHMWFHTNDFGHFADFEKGFGVKYIGQIRGLLVRAIVSHRIQNLWDCSPCTPGVLRAGVMPLFGTI
jgi:hypothetical protein